MRDWMEIIFTFAMIILVVVLIIGYPIYSPFFCKITGNNYGVENKWTWVNGCMLKTPEGIWIPEEKFRGVAQ